MELTTGISNDHAGLAEKVPSTLVEKLSKLVPIVPDEELKNLSSEQFDLQLALRCGDESLWQQACENFSFTEEELIEEVVLSVREFLACKEHPPLQEAFRLLAHLRFEFNKIPESKDTEVLFDSVKEFVDIQWPLPGVLAEVPRPVVLVECRSVNSDVRACMTKADILKPVEDFVESHKQRYLESLAL
jgi:hypothetical protein